MIAPGQILRNRYEIRRTIGRGGMADVYLAFDRKRFTKVAIKVMRDDLAEDPDFVRRFAREARTLAQLDHPNIVRFYSFEREGLLAFLVMDYVDGHTLRAELAQRQGPLNLSEISHILKDVGSALHYAHSQGLIHRDLKPGNIMLARSGRALLTDFGIAKALESATVTTMAAGTPAYMSPEQILGEPLDARTDIYSLGGMLFQMVTGRRPFTGDEPGLTGAGTMARIRNAHLRLAPPIPSQLNPSLPKQVDAIILRALAKDRKDRWPNAATLLRAWQAIPGAEKGMAAFATTPASRAQTPPRTETHFQPQPGRSHTTAFVIVGAASVAIVALLAFLMMSRMVSSPKQPSVASSEKTVQVATTAPAPVAPARHTSQPTQQAVDSQATTDALTEAYAQATVQSIAATATSEAASVQAQMTKTVNELMTATAQAQQQEATAVIATGIASTATAQASPPLPGSGQGVIAFVSHRDGNPEIYLMDADGSNVHRLTRFQGDDWSPAWSPDGGKLAFTSSRNATAPGMHNIYTMNGNGSSVRRLTTNQAWDDYAAWSPAGDHILFVTTADGNAEIFVMQAEGSQIRRLTFSPGDDRTPAWSPDGSAIAFHSNRTGSYQIYMMNPDGSNQRQLTFSNANDYNPVWSPDGSHIAFDSDRDGNREIYVMRSDGSEVRRLTHAASHEEKPAWSPDGRAIAFYSNRSGEGDIYVMWADGSDPTRLTTNPFRDEVPAWH